MGSQTLRIGICSCSEHYWGKFGHLVVFVERSSEGDIGEPLRFELQEILTPERMRRRVLLDTRCHFFLDVHRFDETWFVELTLNELYPNDKAGICWQLHMGGHCTVWKRKLEKRWKRRRIPPVRVILDGVVKLIEEMPLDKQKLWFSRMTPDGWTLPYIVVPGQQ